jgi:hypothetical protein
MEGHEGNLCGRCSQGYGPHMSATQQACRPCVSRSSVLAAYLGAAIASTLLIKLLCVMHAYQAAEEIARTASTASLMSGLSSSTGSSATLQSAPPSVTAVRHCGNPSIELTPYADSTVLSAAPSSSVHNATGRTFLKPGAVSVSKDTCRVSDSSAAKRLPGGMSQSRGSAATGSGATSSSAPGAAAWLNAASGGTAFDGAGVALPKVLAGDLLKPFVVYLQVSLRLSR